MILSARPVDSTSSRMRSAKASWSVVALAPRGDLNSTWMELTVLQASTASAKVGIFSPAQRGSFQLPKSRVRSWSRVHQGITSRALACRSVMYSWWTTRCPSAVKRVSNSMPSTPMAAASRKAARVFSGARWDAPRCATMLGRTAVPSLRGGVRLISIAGDGPVGKGFRKKFSDCSGFRASFKRRAAPRAWRRPPAERPRGAAHSDQEVRAYLKELRGMGRGITCRRGGPSGSRRCRPPPSCSGGRRTTAPER